MTNINYCLSKKLCSGCGACTVICPTNSIKMIEGSNLNYPFIDKKTCCKCKKCLDVCPGIHLHTNISESKLDTNLIGESMKCVVFRSSNEFILNNSASGGFVTSFLLFLLEEKYVDGVICVKQSNTELLNNEMYIAKSKDELLHSMGSRYSPSSNCTILKDIDYNKKYVFVGKPCDIQGLKLLKQSNKNLEQCILLTIGIMCHHTPYRNSLIDIFKYYNINKNEIKKISFRGNGWPGYFKAIGNNNFEFKTPYFNAWNNFFSKCVPTRCSICDDPLAYSADIVAGDPWGDEFKDEKAGASAVIIRTTNALKMYKKFISNNYGTTIDITQKDIERYQKNLLLRKKNINVIISAFSKVFNIPSKEISYQKSIKNHLKYLKYIKFFINRKFKKEYF